MALSTVTYNGAPRGMCPDMPQHEIPDDACWYMQDGLVDAPGLIRRRGPTAIVSGSLTAVDTNTNGAAQVLRPDGAFRGCILGRTSGGDFFDSTGALVSGSYTNIFGTSTGFTSNLTYARPNLTGGTWITSVSANGGTGAGMVLALWKGGCATNYTTGTITVTRGSTAVAGAGTTWTDNHVGAFLFDATDRLIGCVATVVSGTSIILESPALYAVAAGAYTLKLSRPLIPLVAKGTITVTTATTAVTGSETKFVDQGLQSGTWDFYRASDSTFIGQLTGSAVNVPNNYGLTLNAGAAVNMVNEHFFAVNNAGWAIGTQKIAPLSGTRTVLNTPGGITTQHVSRQWFANLPIGNGPYGNYGQRVWFSEDWHGEAVDFSPTDGDFFQVPFTTTGNITNIASCHAGLLVANDQETFIITGNDPLNFTVVKVLADGCPSGMSMVSYEGGVFWAGRHGIYLHNGSTIVNLSGDRLGNYWSQLVQNFDGATSRMRGFHWRDYYFLTITGGIASPISIIKGDTATNRTAMTFAVYLPSRAFTTLSNFHFTGAIYPTANKCWVTAYDGSHGVLLDVATVLDSTGVDTKTLSGESAGPDFYLESKKYSLGDGLRQKVWRQFTIWNKIGTQVLKFDLVPGLTTDGQNITTGWTVTAPTWDNTGAKYSNWDALGNAWGTWDALSAVTWKVYRARRQMISQYMGFRLYQTDATVTEVTLGSWDWGYKLRKPGRIS